MDNVKLCLNEENDKRRFVELVQRLFNVTDYLELKDIKKELARIVFGI